MYIDTDGIVLRQTKTLNGRRMILLFTRQYGKISAGTSISERGKNKTALALRPFTLGHYELFRGRDSYSINGAETVNGYYAIGEDIDRFMAASYVLELTDKLLPEDQPAPEFFDLLKDMLAALEKRRSAFGTLTAGFQAKALKLTGSGPETAICTVCGKTEDLGYISVKQGGTVCAECAGKIDVHRDRLIRADREFLDVFEFLSSGPMKNLETLALKPELEKRVSELLKVWYSWHLGIEDLRSEGLKI